MISAMTYSESIRTVNAVPVKDDLGCRGTFEAFTSLQSGVQSSRIRNRETQSTRGSSKKT